MAGTLLPNQTVSMGRVSTTVESDVLLAILLVSGMVLYLRGIPQKAWSALWGAGVAGESYFVGKPADTPPPSAADPGSPPQTSNPSNQGNGVIDAARNIGNRIICNPLSPFQGQGICAGSTQNPASAPVAPNAPTITYGNYGGVVATPQGTQPGTLNTTTADPQPGGIVGADPTITPNRNITACWVLPDGSTIGLCNG